MFDIAKRLNIKSVQKFLINLQKKTTNPLPTKNTPDFNLDQQSTSGKKKGDNKDLSSVKKAGQTSKPVLLEKNSKDSSN